MSTSTAPGLRQAAATRRLLLASHASSFLFLPIGVLAGAAFPEAGAAAVLGGYLAPTWTALLALVAARLAIRLGHVGPIAPKGHFNVAVRDGAWAALLVALLIMVSHLPTDLATDWLLGAVDEGSLPEAVLAARGFLVGVPFERTAADSVFLYGSLLATMAGCVLVFRGAWAFARLLRGRPVRVGGPGPSGRAGSPLARGATPR